QNSRISSSTPESLVKTPKSQTTTQEFQVLPLEFQVSTYKEFSTQEITQVFTKKMSQVLTKKPQTFIQQKGIQFKKGAPKLTKKEVQLKLTSLIHSLLKKLQD
ncbi:37217_t:CDS:1, partial [Gigaspora margarita]